MFRKFVSCAGLVVLGSFVMLSACASPPRWALEDDPAIRDESEKAVFGVGRASLDLTGREKVRAAAARVRARTNMAQAGAEYAERFIKSFVESNEEWFVLDGLEAFMADYTGTFNALSRSSGRVVDEWVDSRGRLNGAQTVFALARLDLDAAFFSTVKTAFSETLEQHGDNVLNVEAETVLSGLDDAVEMALERPFQPLVPAAAPEPEVEETEQEEPRDDDADEAGNDEE